MGKIKELALEEQQKAEQYFTCNACRHELPLEFQIRTEGFCYLCDPNVTVEELLQ